MTRDVIRLRKLIRAQRIALQNAINNYYSHLSNCTNARSEGNRLRAEIDQLRASCNNTYLITSPANWRSGFCVDVSGISQSAGAKVHAWDCWNGPNQHWRMDAKNRLVSKNSGMCLDVWGGGNGNGTRVVQWPCHDGANQKWIKDGSLLKPAHAPDKCLDVYRWDRRNGADLVIWQCHGGTNQQWNFTKQAGPPPPKYVTFYEHCGYQGRGVSKGPGHYDIHRMGIGNDTISSIKVPAGMSVTVYQHAHYGGHNATFTSDVDCLVGHKLIPWLTRGGPNWNDQISSFVVRG